MDHGSVELVSWRLEHLMLHDTRSKIHASIVHLHGTWKRGTCIKEHGACYGT